MGWVGSSVRGSPPTDAVVRTFGGRSRTLAVATPAVLFLLPACEVGPTDVSGGTTGPVETAPTGPTESTGSMAPTGPTGEATLAGTWDGTWDTDIPQVNGTFSWVIEVTPNGLEGTIDVQGPRASPTGR